MRKTHGVIFDFIHKLKRDSSRLEVLVWPSRKSYMEVKDCVKAMMHIFTNTKEPVNLFNLGAMILVQFDVLLRLWWMRQIPILQ